MNELAEKVLVTGGAGFIGSHLVDRLVDCGYQVKVLDNLSTGKLDNIRMYLDSNRIEFVESDIRDRITVDRCVSDVDMVVHLAAQTSVPFSVENPDLTYDVNLEGTLNLLRSCGKTNVKKFVFASTCAVYGDPAFLPLTEEHPTEPISPYAVSKLAAEQFCLGFGEAGFFSAVAFRFFNVYGPRQGLNSESGVITRFVDRSRRGLPLVIYGDGSQTRDFVFVRDVVNAIMRGLSKDKLKAEVFNVGSGVQTSIRELALAVLERAKGDSGVVYERARAGDIVYSWADIAKIRSVLEFKPRFTLKMGLGTLLP